MMRNVEDDIEFERYKTDLKGEEKILKVRRNLRGTRGI